MDIHSIHMKKQLIWLSVVLCGLTTGCAQQNQDRSASLAPHTVRADNGETYVGELGHISVPENRENEKTGLIRLPFFRIRTEHPNPLPPIFIFEGGPGDNPSALERLREFAPILASFAQRSDVVLVDQRGNGLSVPKLGCPSPLRLPLDAPLEKESFKRQYRQYITDCAAYWQEQGRDLQGYNVVAMADDTDAVRKFLSYDKIMLFGGSFGAHHALTYVKQYPDRVDRILLDSPEGLQHTLKLPYEVDKVLMQLSALVEKDSVWSKKIPSFGGLVTEVLQDLETKPVTVEVTHPETQKRVPIVLGKYDLQLATGMALGRIGYRELPQHYLNMEAGDYSWLANYAVHFRYDQGVSLMAALTDNSSGGTPERRALVSEQAKDAILGDVLNNVIFEVSDLLPLQDISKVLVPNFSSQVPLLLICGSQDARTPLRNAREIMANFEQGRLLEVRYGSHDLYREVLDTLAPIMMGYLAADDPVKYPLPNVLKAPLYFGTD